MCIHNEADRKRYEAYVARKKEPMSTVALRKSVGTLIGAWPVPYRETQKIANTIRDIKAWHKAGMSSNDWDGVWIDMESVNKARMTEGLEALTAEGMPIPIGEALPQDMDVDLVIRGRDGFTEFERGLNRYVAAQNLQLQAVGA